MSYSQLYKRFCGLIVYPQALKRKTPKLTKMKLNLGCYNNIKEGYINLDKKKYFDGIDIAHNLEEFPYPFKDNTFEEVYARYIIDHIRVEKRIKVMKELHRICRNGAVIRIIVPYKDKIYKSLDHKGGFNFYTFPNLCQQKDYILKERFELIRQGHKPTNFSKYFIPNKWIREKLSNFINEIVEDIDVELKVIK